MDPSSSSAAAARWFEVDAARLLDERNRREVDYFQALIESYQELVIRHQGMQASVSNLSASMSMSRSMSASVVGGASSSSSATTHVNDADAVASKYLTTIQELEKELSAKNAQLAQYAGSQLQLVNESKELLQAREQWGHQLTLFTKRLEEEMLLNQEKDRAMQELNAALELVRHELTRHKALLDGTETENTTLRGQLRELEAALQRKNEIMQDWLAANEGGSGTAAALSDSDRRALASSSINSNGTGPRIISQEMAESMSHLYLDAGESSTVTAASANVVTRVVHSIRAHATEVNSVCFNASGKVLFSGSSDGTVRAWETATCRPMGEYRGVGTAHPLLCVRVSEDGERVLGTGCDRKCFVWRVGTGRVFQTLTGHKGKVLAAEFSLLSPNHVITGSSDRTMRVWDVARGQSLQAINCRSSCNDVAMALGGQFASAHHDGTVRCWDARSRHLVQEIRDLHTSQVTSVSFGRDGDFLLTNSRDHTLRVIDTRTFTSLFTLQHARYQTGFDWCKASLSTDGRLAVAGSTSGAVFIWNTATGRLETELPADHHQGAIACAVWRPDGHGVASCDKNGVLVMWE